jgi:hypothetical protein
MLKEILCSSFERVDVDSVNLFFHLQHEEGFDLKGVTQLSKMNPIKTNSVEKKILIMCHSEFFLFFSILYFSREGAKL